LVFEDRLKKTIESYGVFMDNVQIDAETLKNYQLIRYGLQIALNIPKSLEAKAKISVKEKH